jgi:homocysteine S-methyltransferase
VIAVGVNCTAPAAIGPTVAAAAVAGKPVVVYPNSGESWDAVGRRWTGSPGIAVDDVASWVASGARLVGGCCRVGPEHIAAIAAAVAAVRPS